MHHYAMACGQVIVQVHGKSPFQGVLQRLLEAAVAVSDPLMAMNGTLFSSPCLGGIEAQDYRMPLL